MTNPTVSFMGYNSTGIDKQKCMKNIDYLSIQEHFKISKNTDQYFSDKFNKFNSYVIPGYRAAGQDNGRPKAGLAQLSRKDLDIRKDRIVTKNFRLQAQILNFSTSRLLWLNAYLPNDPQNDTFDGSEDQISDIRMAAWRAEATDEGADVLRWVDRMLIRYKLFLVLT